MINRILDTRAEVIRNNHEPRYLVMNEADLRSLKDCFTSELFGADSVWRDIIGGKIYGMLIVFNPDIDKLEIIYDTFSQKELRNE